MKRGDCGVDVTRFREIYIMRRVNEGGREPMELENGRYRSKTDFPSSLQFISEKLVTVALVLIPPPFRPRTLLLPR